MDRSDTENRLLQDSNPKGTFLIRESMDFLGEYCLSVRDTHMIKHHCIRKEKEETGDYYLASRIKFSSLEALVSHYQKN